MNEQTNAQIMLFLRCCSEATPLIYHFYSLKRQMFPAVQHAEDHQYILFF